MSKRQRLDGDGRSIRQLELELELARLRREQEEEEESTPSNEIVEVGSVPPPVPPSSSTPATARHQQPPPTATPSTAQNNHGAIQATPAAGNHPGNASARGQGRGGRGGGARGGRTRRGARIERTERGLLTVFVCVAHDDLFCQVCNAYEPSDKYWERQHEG